MLQKTVAAVLNITGIVFMYCPDWSQGQWYYKVVNCYEVQKSQQNRP